MYDLLEERSVILDFIAVIRLESQPLQFTHFQRKLGCFIGYSISADTAFTKSYSSFCI